MPKPKVINEKEPTQNAKELNLLRNILACVFNFGNEKSEIRKIEHRARALGLLEGMIAYKEWQEKI